MKTVLNKMIQGDCLSTQEAYDALRLFQEDTTLDVQIASFLSLLHMRGEHIEELQGFLRLLLEHVRPIHIRQNIILDVVGTGGDGKSTFNISTAIALLVASAGFTVAKHGGRAVSSQSGATDCVGALGIPLYQDVAALQQSIEKHHFGFIVAPYFNPFLNEFGPLRRALGIRTFFNILGPILNPANVTHRLIGVSEHSMMHKVAALLLSMGSNAFMVVHSEDGLDEISISSPTHYIRHKNGHREEGIIDPALMDITTAPMDAIIGGDARENAGMIEAIFAGQQGPKTEIVVLGAAAAFLLIDAASTWSDAIRLARSTLQKGNAKSLLEKLREEKHV